MTTSPYEQAPEALRLADDLEASSFFPGNRRSRINAGAAELRRIHAENEALHAENEALRAGYNAARLEIESLKTPVIPGVQWHHHVELLRMIPAGSKLYTAPQPSPASQGDAARRFFDAGWKACANFCDRDDVRFDGIVGHRGCPQFEEAFRAARKQGGV